MNRQNSIADLLLIVAAYGFLFTFPRWFGYDGAIVAAPFCGAIAGRLFARMIWDSGRTRWVCGILAGGAFALATCLSDPRGGVVVRPFTVAFGTVVCLVYGIIATLILEGLVTMRQWLASRRESHAIDENGTDQNGSVARLTTR